MSNVIAGKEIGKPRAFDTIVWVGLAAGVLDSVDAVVAFGFKGMNPIQVLQYVASGLLGANSFRGGLATAALGTGLHFLIAFVVAAVYYAASLKFQPSTGRQQRGDCSMARLYTCS